MHGVILLGVVILVFLVFFVRTIAKQLNCITCCQTSNKAVFPTSVFSFVIFHFLCSKTVHVFGN